MLGTVFHYAVVEPEADHAYCERQREGIIAMHERMGYRQGGAYNGHFCVHGQYWVSYTGPNQATGDTWANLNLHAWCYLATVGTPVTPQAQQAAYDLTLFEPTGRDQIYPHSAFYATSCCGDPLREWIAAGALPPSAGVPQEDRMQPALFLDAPSGRVYVYDPNNHTKTWVSDPAVLAAWQALAALNGTSGNISENETTRALLADAVDLRAVPAVGEGGVAAVPYTVSGTFTGTATP